MPKAERLSEQVRQAVRDSGRTQYALSEELGLPRSMLSRFMRGERGLSMSVLDRLGVLLDLRISAGERRGKTKR